MSEGLPPGMTAANGTFLYGEEEFGQVDMTVSHAEFSLYCDLENPGMLDLNLMIAATPQEAAIPEDPEEMHLLDPAITVQWLTISADRLNGRALDALDGFSERFKATGALDEQPPAAIECGFYGMVTEMDLGLARRDGCYRLALRATDEMDRKVDIDALIAPFDVSIRAEDGTSDPAAEAWLATHFDTDLMDRGWQVRGSGDHTWQVLEARFKETKQ
ncbi:MAG: hypothetical protein AAGH68_03340 [Pseudomonadota bacterium]